jgi:hypothetical protein
MQYWAGFQDDRIDTRHVNTGWGGKGASESRMPMLFISKAEAREQYEDVRKVEVRVVSKARR